MKERSFVNQITKVLTHGINLLQICRKEHLSLPFPHMRRENGQKKELARKQITKDRASQVEIREVILSFFQSQIREIKVRLSQPLILAITARRTLTCSHKTFSLKEDKDVKNIRANPVYTKTSSAVGIYIR
ncbi:Altered inheritance of mitochondria protein 3-1 [Bienertia sinuspersici]